MAALDLQTLSRLVVDPSNDLDLHDSYLGFRSRHDAWSATQWRRTGDHHLLFLVHDGEMRISWKRGQAVTCAPGMAVLLAPDLRPDIRFSRSMRYHEVYFRPHRRRKAVRLSPAFLAIDRGWELADGIDRLAAEIQLDRDESLTVARHWLGLLLAQFARQLTAPRPAGRVLSTAERARLLRWFRAHLWHHPAPHELAAAAGLSADYFSRIFRATFGVNPRDWIVRERMREACRLLLESDNPVYTVAEQMGYESVAHFCRQFRQVIGRSPGAWRKGG